ncbi:MAG: four helix bundle protein [Bacteroidales bacterium]
MRSDNIIQEKTYAFAIRIVQAYKYLAEEKKEYVLSKQLLRSGTSIGENTEEAIDGQTEKDFYAKLNIVYKEARETHYWIRLLKDTNFFDEHQAQSLLNDCEEILKITGSIIKTMKHK